MTAIRQDYMTDRPTYMHATYASHYLRAVFGSLSRSSLWLLLSAD